MALADELHDALIKGYHQAAAQTGYRGNRFLQAVRRKGGLATAKRMLKPRTQAQRAGLDRLLEAGKPELTVEFIVLRPKFMALFTPEELDQARIRLGKFIKQAAVIKKQRERLYPDDLEPGRTYVEEGKKQVRVNAYERDPKARRACLAHHGSHCAVCQLSFEDRYGSIGKGFIHVHHTRPLAAAGKVQTLDPKRDLVPVCPNCHAMLHRTEPPMSVQKLLTIVRRQMKGNA